GGAAGPELLNSSFTRLVRYKAGLNAALFWLRLRHLPDAPDFQASSHRSLGRGTDRWRELVANPAARGFAGFRANPGSLHPGFPQRPLERISVAAHHYAQP